MHRILPFTRHACLLLCLIGGIVFSGPLFSGIAKGGTPADAGQWKILPGDFTLYGRHGRQQLSVVAVDRGTILAVVADDRLQIVSSDPGIVRVEDGIASAVSNGRATLTARLGDQDRATVMVDVVGVGVGVDAEHRWSFRNDIQSIFSKVGCNSGACHGALAGKGGFRLSLHGYDSEADFKRITREARGRRVEMSDPGRSLLLAKPTGALPHKGGLKLDTESRDYQIIADWIAGGANGPTESDARLLHITVSPPSALLRPGDRSQILVQARYDNDQLVDVTHWSRFTATDESIASVDSSGAVSVRGSGETAVLVWFGSKVALARMTIPFPNEIDPQVYADSPRRNFIDDLNLQQLQTLQLRPSPPCDDEAFVRRATLDTIGRLPTKAEWTEFLDQPSHQRRDWLIDQLLASEDYVDYWAYRLSDVLLINGNLLRPDAVKTYYQWVHDAIGQNQPWDELVREVLTSTGSTTSNGATNFFSINQSPEDMTENACQAFMGLSIGCAKCHNHPLEKWTNDQYYAMASLFSRVRAKGWGGDGRNGDGNRTVFVTATGELIQPNRGKPQQPAPLDAEPLDFDDPRDRRETLAAWMTDPANPYFSRAITNRIWANFFGRGLVEQVDDLRLSNPASCEPLLAATAQHLVDIDFDLKQLMRTILHSNVYQRTSVALDQNRDEQKYFSRYYPRRLMAEVLLDSIDQVLQTATNFNEIAFAGADKRKTDFYPQGTRAIELYDSAVSSYFLKTFGRNPREITCECERSGEPSMVQVLHLSNGETLNPKLADADNCIGRKLESGADDKSIIEDLFVAALARKPSEAELENLLTIRAEYGDDRTTALQDIAWSILTSTEFTFNH